MTITPIQVIDQSVLIPRAYLPDAESFEFVLTKDYVIVRPKDSDTNEDATQSPLHALIGIASTKDPTASARVKEILTEEWGVSKPQELE